MFPGQRQEVVQETDSTESKVASRSDVCNSLLHSLKSGVCRYIGSADFRLFGVFENRYTRRFWLHSLLHRKIYRAGPSITTVFGGVVLPLDTHAITIGDRGIWPSSLCRVGRSEKTRATDHCFTRAYCRVRKRRLGGQREQTLVKKRRVRWRKVQAVNECLGTSGAEFASCSLKGSTIPVSRV